jgi:hypothetical protein
VTEVSYRPRGDWIVLCISIAIAFASGLAAGRMIALASPAYGQALEQSFEDSLERHAQECRKFLPIFDKRQRDKASAEVRP